MEIVELTGTEVTGISRGLRGHLARPPGEGPWPGLVVLFEAFGGDEANLLLLEHAASLGYLALMPDLYSQGGARRCLAGTLSALVTGQGRAYRDIEAARQWLIASPDCTGAVGSLGFCMGGGFALATTRTGFEAAAASYGIIPRRPQQAFDGACPIVASYGGRDLSLRGAADKLERELTRAGVPHDVKEYPDAGHAFMNEVPNAPKAIRPFARAIMRIGPRPEETADAWRRIDAFLGQHLRGGTIDG